MLQPVEATPAGVDAATSDALLVAAGPQERLAEAVKSTVCAMRAAHGYGSGEEGTDLQVGGVVCWGKLVELGLAGGEWPRLR